MLTRPDDGNSFEQLVRIKGHRSESAASVPFPSQTEREREELFLSSEENQNGGKFASA